MLRKIALIICLIAIGGCATQGAGPRLVTDAPANRVYWDGYTGDGYRIKVTRDVGQMGSLCMTKVFIDDKIAAEIGNGESVVFKVSPGPHSLKAAPVLTTTQCKNFYSAPQFQVEAAVEGVTGEVKVFQYGFMSSGLPALAPVAQ